MRKYKKTLICPKCKSKNIARYQYGMPVMDPDMERNLDKGKIVRGGCCVTENDPDRNCNNCEND